MNSPRKERGRGGQARGLLLGLIVAGEAAMAGESVGLTSGELRLAFEAAPTGIRLTSLFDTGRQQELLAGSNAPLFEAILRRGPAGKDLELTASAGWTEASARRRGERLELVWRRPADQDLAGLEVRATAQAQPALHRVAWQFAVRNGSAGLTLWRVAFPQVSVRWLGPGSSVLFPRGPGEVQTDVWDRSFNYRGDYPGGWCSMQFLAVYRGGGEPTGLYAAVHDPWGSTKNIQVDGDPAARAVRLRFDHPAPDLGRAGNGFALEGAAVWQLLRGDWYDAARLYKAWVRQDARWWPGRGRERRPGTPAWMRDLDAWTMGGGAPAECVGHVEKFQEYLGAPAGFHWYNWHQIPFDNDYPHYFPAKPGVPEGVAELQRHGVYVMPYINGRLWDSHDQGAGDAQFGSLALPAATKNAEGKPFLESYGSKETNGQPVRLAAMCPTTALWQETVRTVVLRLLGEVGTRGVYIDQVAAAAPTLCQDPAHGHPLGGGHWWNEGYWRMLEGIRRQMPRQAMLTTECNGEPFVRWFDGYLTWHWQHDGQVPAFPAVYGEAIRMFGRAYRGGATKDLALRMKAGQQLVFGEQPGWLDPGLIQEPENAAFFRQIVRLRAALEPGFPAGEMARPPRLEGGVPQVRADWQWSGEWFVATPAVLTGAWRSSRDRRLYLLFVNVGDGAVSATLDFRASEYGVSGSSVRLRTIGPGTAAAPPPRLPATFKLPLVSPPREAFAWELAW